MIEETQAKPEPKPEFWIPIAFADEEVEERVMNAIGTCYIVHYFTLDALNRYCTEKHEPLRYGDFQADINGFIRERELTKRAQRYSLVRAAEQTFPYWAGRAENSRHKRKKFIAVQPIERERYLWIQLENRKVWRKYMALNNLISTAYGTVYLDESWLDVLDQQAESLGVPLKTLPYLTHSITLYLDRFRPRIKFNAHEPDSFYGKIALKEMKKDEKLEKKEEEKVGKASNS